MFESDLYQPYNYDLAYRRGVLSAFDAFRLGLSQDLDTVRKVMHQPGDVDIMFCVEENRDAFIRTYEKNGNTKGAYRSLVTAVIEANYLLKDAPKSEFECCLDSGVPYYIDMYLGIIIDCAKLLLNLNGNGNEGRVANAPMLNQIHDAYSDCVEIFTLFTFKDCRCFVKDSVGVPNMLPKFASIIGNNHKVYISDYNHTIIDSEGHTAIYDRSTMLCLCSGLGEIVKTFCVEALKGSIYDYHLVYPM